MGLVATLRKSVKAALPAPLRTRVEFVYEYARSFLPKNFESIGYVIHEVPKPDLGDISIDTVESRQPLTAEQMAFLRLGASGVTLWSNLRALRAGPAWLFLRAADGQYSCFSWVVHTRYLLPCYPFMQGERALFLGPVFTDPRYRGQNIMARVMQYSIWHVNQCGYTPLYGLVAPHNAPSIRGCEKAGWIRVGVWRGRSTLRDRIVRTERISD